MRFRAVLDVEQQVIRSGLLPRELEDRLHLLALELDRHALSSDALGCWKQFLSCLDEELCD